MAPNWCAPSCPPRLAFVASDAAAVDNSAPLQTRPIPLIHRGQTVQINRATSLLLTPMVIGEIIIPAKSCGASRVENVHCGDACRNYFLCPLPSLSYRLTIMCKLATQCMHQPLLRFIQQKLSIENEPPLLRCPPCHLQRPVLAT